MRQELSPLSVTIRIHQFIHSCRDAEPDTWLDSLSEQRARISILLDHHKYKALSLAYNGTTPDPRRDTNTLLRNLAGTHQRFRKVKDLSI